MDARIAQQVTPLERLLGKRPSYAKSASHDAYEAWRADRDDAAKRAANTRRFQACFASGAARLGVEAWDLDGVERVLDRWFEKHGSRG